jgi:hypothetical protein
MIFPQSVRGWVSIISVALKAFPGILHICVCNHGKNFQIKRILIIFHHSTPSISYFNLPAFEVFAQ